MRPGAGVDDRVVTNEVELLGIVPAPSQVAPVVVVLGIRRPDRDGPAVGIGVEIEDHLLPIGLVVVRAVEPGSPVVEGVEEPVLERGPGRGPHDAPVVRVLRTLGGHRPVSRDGAARQRARDLSPREEGDREHRVDEPRRVPDARQAPAVGVEADRLPALGPEEGCDIVSRSGSGHGHEVADRHAVGHLVGEGEVGECPLGPERPMASVPVGLHSHGGGEVGRDAHRQERLAIREAHHRLEGAQQLDVRRVERAGEAGLRSSFPCRSSARRTHVLGAHLGGREEERADRQEEQGDVVG